jgi:hypothetical protein
MVDYCEIKISTVVEAIAIKVVCHTIAQRNLFVAIGTISVIKNVQLRTIISGTPLYHVRSYKAPALYL